MRELMQGLREAAMKAIFEAEDVERLEELRIKYLGKKGEMTAILRQMGKLSPEERPVMGQLANQVRSEIEGLLDERKRIVSEAMLEKKLEREAMDVTLPGTSPTWATSTPCITCWTRSRTSSSAWALRSWTAPRWSRRPITSTS